MQNLSTLLCVSFGLIFMAHELVGDGVLSFNVNWKVDEVSDKVGEMCPNNRTKCNERQTCCETKHHSYHCCRYANAVCCPDKFHCCPEGTTCDTRRKRCSRPDLGNTNEPMEWPIIQELESPKHEEEITLKDEIMCPNNKTKCKDTKTCCITKHNNYYCCPHKNAVCCSDKYQCCPSDTTCDLANKKCVKPSYNSKLDQHEMDVAKPLHLTPAKLLRGNSLLFIMKLEKKCHNTNLTCPGHTPCCVMAGGKYGCCKYEKGVCCSDMKTCCTHGTTCDVTNGKCFTDSSSLVPLN